MNAQERFESYDARLEVLKEHFSLRIHALINDLRQAGLVMTVDIKYRPDLLARWVMVPDVRPSRATMRLLMELEADAQRLKELEALEPFEDEALYRELQQLRGEP